ncbi:rRNA adenine methyltransferase [Aphanothece hegewaldii CCALA 016]|uniref:rRNA adenine methyltransferase n=1 Tax=Aphanothece hegewaldii CCALA 016 TaxID=2107694 RepID=A0A2T1M3D3_9CHRO|nr:class II aldolase/adducin family protein [Aphanothece hegewaldii]PSF39328.1 rRNA adenine methyltransferase [Aphanothece hegewaldii CCALA 016]
MFDEGYTKYDCNWIIADPLPQTRIEKMNQWRTKFYQLGLIGQYENGIGFGNISIREGNSSKFIISGTQTGGMNTLTSQHYTTVIDYNWEKNHLTCFGPIQASSESLTHGAIYQANPEINGIIHVHHLELWRNLMDEVPTTSAEIEYGTPQMAKEIIRLCREANLLKAQILVMKGHLEGIIAFGKSLDEAANLLLKYFYVSKGLS